MKVDLAYFGHSGIVESSHGQTLSLVPNLAREKVSFDAPLLYPLRFREAISALHDVVINDLRFKPRDKTAHEEWKKQQAVVRREIYRRAHEQAKEQIAKETNREALPAGFEQLFQSTRQRYWAARFKLADLMRREDPELFRWLMPCDPVITVAPDVLFFECFSSDESSYGCLTVSRDGFGADSNAQSGTTNVDYSWNLYNHFQSLRSYRDTRFLIDPTGFEVKTEAIANYREEKIDLPDGWLRGFMTTQEAMGMPGLTVSLSREAVYSALAFLKRHKAKASPRAIRFELLPGQPPALVLEPWEKRIVSYGTRYDGPATAPIRVWGARRLLVLARVLPLTERFDVTLIGTGLPSFWVARMGEMALTVGLSGWTTNDWTRGSGLDLLAPPATVTQDAVAKVAALLREHRSLSQSQLQTMTSESSAVVLAVLRRLAFSGQVIHDLPNQRYRYRQVMAMPLGDAQLGPENEELSAARQLMLRSNATGLKVEEAGTGKLITGKVESTPAEILVDLDGRIRRGKCVCGHFRQFGIRNGPCRHMIVLRSLSTTMQYAQSAEETATT